MKMFVHKMYLIIGSIAVFIILIQLVITTNPALPAQAADNVLRPLIGSQKTIDLESFYFSLNDQIDKVTYNYKKPSADIFTSSLLGSSEQERSISTNSAMSTTNIAIQNSFPPLPQEGIWLPIDNTLFPNETVLARTFIRPDTSRSYAIVSLVKMNMKKLNIGLQAGTYYPGGPKGIFGPGYIPKSILQSNSLIAAFNGGFMEKDGHYGMIIGNKTYVPLRNNLATLLVLADGSAQIIDYQGQTLPMNVVGIRQNGAFLVHNSLVTSFVESDSDTWGRTTTNSMYTWRSGIGITKSGDLIYAVGNSLIPATLANALKSAGAIEAMQLDINPYWVRYILYTSLGKGNYSYIPLLTNMQQNGGYSYIHSYNKDFFYIYTKPSS
ncbi:MAG TPA: phosphodiester glycosidase family protein [Candidatus Sulfotelmatobacter sp.]|jgi:hypothetical protein|nr:phosphodiester glycosidase family protein [Candidatus Sulfotelmatobacter sp.]